MKKIKIGSRDSKLAMAQSYWVRDKLLEKYPYIEVEILEIKTKGDKILDQALSKIGDKGLFTKELENELLAGNIDLAVHSMKDLPTNLPEGLEIICTSLREDVRDVVCIAEHAKAKGYKRIEDCKTIASSSLRRVAQLKRKYPDKNFVDIRGNLQTRFKKLDDEANNIDAVILAAAGLHRLDMQERISQYLDPQEILPAVGQGALGIEMVDEAQPSFRTDVRNLLRSVINDDQTEKIVKAERAYLRTLEGGCQVPVGIFANLIDLDEKNLKLLGMVSSLDGKEYISDTIQGHLDDCEKLGNELAQRLLEKGAQEILSSIR